MAKRTFHCGFTLVELVVTVALVALILGLGVPSFRALTERNRVATAVNEFIASLALAKSEAVKRAVRVTQCKSADGATCIAAGDWQQGWIVFTDPNNNATVEEGLGETILSVSEPIAGNLTLVGDANVVNYISFVADGTSQTIAGAFQAGTLQLRGGSIPANDRDIELGMGGRFKLKH